MKMEDKKTTVLYNEEKSSKWPRKGDLFYLKTTDGYYFGQVFSERMKIGPFKNALLVCFFKSKYNSLSCNIENISRELLTPPIITDNSCWKKGIFKTITNQNIDEELFNRLLLVNPLNNRIYNLDDHLYENHLKGMILAERSLNFYKAVISSIENVIN
ncbi:hypothetical protein GCM10022423_09910 [Flavobacterium ginsengiterrae]|uniref:Immunity protein 26 of polymorphic toxin system n=2 Tax=Flavobacterium ginsengiterrae TaxID=871695 RepID=A0ABP7GE57_9FLAO